MLFWIVAALLTLVASLAVLLPLGRNSSARVSTSSNDIEVYRDQLNEVDRDVARSLILPAEAEQARAEIGRRILRIAGDKRPEGSRSGRLARTIGGVAVLAVPLLSWGLYSALGSPELPSQPLEARLSKVGADSSADELVARAERALRDNPQDGRGWDVLAPVYQKLGRSTEAVFAYRNAIKLLGDSAERSSGLGVALSDVAGGTISADASAAFENALALEPDFPKARFFLNIAAAQEGRFDVAIAGWDAMVKTLPEASEWRRAAEQAIGLANERKQAAGASVGPSAADMAAAEQLPAGERADMIAAMVASLDEKLKANPADPDGWKRLVRSYVVLGKPDAARDALARGRKALGDPGLAADLTKFAASLGLTETE